MKPELHNYFSMLYTQSNDPYGVRSRWYEKRKRALLLAALPQERYARAFEPGCGTGALTLALASRCDLVVASDGSERAAEIARERTRLLPNVRVTHACVPRSWPTEPATFDLIVLSELGYFLEPAAMQEVAQACLRSLAPGGTLVACDWLPDFAERAQPTESVHATLEALRLPRLLRHEEDDFVLQLWSNDARSVAQREGIR